MSLNLKKGSAISSLSLTPLIDVVFLLLAFFLVVARFADEERELAVVLPPASEAKPLSAKPKELFVNVDGDGNYMVQSRMVNVEQLEGILQQAASRHPGTQKVIIRADENCVWKHVVAVMNLCNRAQISDYVVATRDQT